MRSLRQAFLILLAALVSAGVSALVHPRRPPWSEDALLPGEVTLKTVLAWGPKVLWVDARSQNEYQAEHVPNAILWQLRVSVWKWNLIQRCRIARVPVAHKIWSWNCA